ncbi:hypothetical protein [Kribbella flavida]|nr:hypothetical protein [Kribbella flavida]
MTSYPGQPPAPKRTLTRLAIASFVVGLVLSAFFVWRVVDSVPSTPSRISEGPVQLKSDGLTVYSSVPVLVPTCTAKDASGADIPLERPSGSQEFTVNGKTWYVVAQSVDKVPAQEVVVDCQDDQTSATYYAGPKLALGTFISSVLLGIGSFLLFFVIGVVLLVVDNVKRRRARRANTFPGGPGTFPGGPPPHQP